MEIKYRQATENDQEQIALLHARSWQQHYRGDFSDDFLDNMVVGERLGVWKERFDNPKPNQHIIIAESEGKIYGFICAFWNDDPAYGTYIDNLHVSSECKGQGIGTKLIKLLAMESQESYPESKLYLWVLANNKPAIEYYEHLGGKNIETVLSTEIGDREIKAHRVVWDNARMLM